MTETARLVEIFSSVQGEGVLVGERQTFVRFQGCALKCKWCDTPENFTYHPFYRVEKKRFSGEWIEEPNPVSVERLNQWIDHFSDPHVSLTGGEPLQQVEFLERWLPKASQSAKFFLETNGILPDALSRVIDWIDWVSMDLKLPSSAQTGAFWEKHAAFLKIARQTKVYVKIVLTNETTVEEVRKGVELVFQIDPEITVILQPVSSTDSFQQIPSWQHLAFLVEEARTVSPNLRVIPQTHKILGVS